jgi:hypothetical protein
LLLPFLNSGCTLDSPGSWWQYQSGVSFRD